jgi:hypothetical protein
MKWFFFEMNFTNKRRGNSEMNEIGEAFRLFFIPELIRVSIRKKF